ncbi:MAG: hypothetical protein ACLR1G_14595 [Alistipes indistinctus]
MRPAPLRLNHGPAHTPFPRHSLRPPNRTGSRSLPVPPSPGGDGLCGGLHRPSDRLSLAARDPGRGDRPRRLGSPATVAYDNRDTLSERTLYVTARLRNNFGYDRLTLAVTTTTPDGYKWRDTVSIRAFDGVPEAGLFFDREQLVRTRTTFARPGRYLFTFSPVMPGGSIEGVAAVGIDIR